MQKNPKVSNQLKLDEILGLDKFHLTYFQRCDCISLFNHYDKNRAIEQAEKFHQQNTKR